MKIGGINKDGYLEKPGRKQAKEANNLLQSCSWWQVSVWVTRNRLLADEI